MGRQINRTGRYIFATDFSENGRLRGNILNKFTLLLIFISFLFIVPMNVFAYDPPYPLPYDDGTHIYSQFISFYDGNDTPFGNQWYIGGNCQDQSYIDNPSTNDFQDVKRMMLVK